MGLPKIRTYIDNYIKFGFTFMEKDSIQKHQCVFCRLIFSSFRRLNEILSDEEEFFYPSGLKI